MSSFGNTFSMCSSVTCTFAAAREAPSNLSVPAMPIISSFAKTSNATSTLQHAIDQDLWLLYQLIWIEPWNMKTALHTPTLWQNSTWAADLDIIQGDPTCMNDTWYAYLPMPEINNHYSLDGCLSMRVDEHCRLIFHPPLCLIVIGCGLVKILSMFLTARLDRKEVLLTIGDAITSFLDRPDPTTDGWCLMSRRGAVRKIWCRGKKNQDDPGKVFPLRKKRWMAAAGTGRWIITLMMYVIFLLWNMIGWVLIIIKDAEPVFGFQQHIFYIFSPTEVRAWATQSSPCGISAGPRLTRIYWSVLYLGRQVNPEQHSPFSWQTRHN